MSSGADPPEMRFDFRESLFDGRAIRRVGWQEEQFTATGLDELSHARSFMDAQIVQHHDLSSGETWGQEVFDICFKGQGIDGPLDDHAGSDALERQGGQQRRIFPAVARHAAMGALTFRSAGIPWSQRDVGATFIHYYQALGIHLLHLLAPVDSLVLTPLAGCQRLFLRVQPTRLMARLIVAVLTLTPWLCSHRWQ